MNILFNCKNEHSLSAWRQIKHKNVELVKINSVAKLSAKLASMWQCDTHTQRETQPQTLAHRKATFHFHLTFTQASQIQLLFIFCEVSLYCLSHTLSLRVHPSAFHAIWFQSFISSLRLISNSPWLRHSIIFLITDFVRVCLLAFAAHWSVD